MPDNKEASTGNPTANKFKQFIKKNGFTMLLVAAIAVLLLVPDAKSWLLRQLMVTGIFNANIEEKGSATTTQSTIDFDFEDAKGTIQNTVSLRGKVVFINFWASWCPPCRAEFPSVEKLYSTFKTNSGVMFLMINEDNDRSAARRYLEKEKFSVPFYKTKGNVPDLIYKGTLPTTVVLDKDGKIRFRHEGFANYGSEKFVKQMEALINE